MARDRTLLPRRERCAVVAAAIALCACAHGAGARVGREAEVRAAIAAANAEFARALVAGDARAMAAVFEADGELVPPGRQGFVTGRDAIEAYEASLLAGRRYLDAALATVRLGVSGDLAWELGTSRVTIQQGELAPIELTGRYLAVWRRGADGRWRIRVDLPVGDPPP
jgi:uncharacterized protein (TIGR02246 family)